jgi:hypothetical protein
MPKDRPGRQATLSNHCLVGLPALVHIDGTMSLLEEMRAERDANAAIIMARVGGLLGQGDNATTQDNPKPSQNVTHGGHTASTPEHEKLSQSVNHCGRPATANDNPKLSQGMHGCAQSESATDAIRFPQNFQSHDGKRLARLLDEYRRGFGMSSATERAVEMAIEFGVSLRSAQRHIKQGTVPAEDRKLGADGKHHPVRNTGRVRSRCERELILARQALARAARAAANGIQPGERELLKQIQVMAADMRKGATTPSSKRA